MLENYNSMWLILKYQFLRSKLIYYECLFFHLWFNFYRETGIEGMKYLLGNITFALDGWWKKLKWHLMEQKEEKSFIPNICFMSGYV